jgi:hypothetical protein
MGNVIQMQQECGSVSCDGKTRVQLPPVQWVLRMSGEQRGWHSGTVHFPDAQSDQNFGPMAELRWTNNMADYNEYAGKIESDSDFEDERYLCVDEMDRAKREYKTIESLLASRGVISADYDLPICRFRREDGRRCVYWLLEESGGVFAWAWPRGDYSDRVEWAFDDEPEPLPAPRFGPPAASTTEGPRLTLSSKHGESLVVAVATDQLRPSAHSVPTPTLRVRHDAACEVCGAPSSTTFVWRSPCGAHEFSGPELQLCDVCVWVRRVRRRASARWAS